MQPGAAVHPFGSEPDPYWTEHDLWPSGLPRETRIADALDAVRNSTAPPEALHVVFANDGEGHAVGAVSVARTDPITQAFFAGSNCFTTRAGLPAMTE